MDPVRIALRETLIGLVTQIPDWLPMAPIDYWGDEDGEGYRRVTEAEPKNLRWMASTCLLNLEAWPVDKTSRWIGFIQGVLAVKSKDFSVQAERDRTRPFFHKAYAASGQAVPETQNQPADRHVKAKALYEESINNHPTIHCNRFPSWAEMDAAARQVWYDKVDHG